MSEKGLTKWFHRDVHPVRVGQYECAVKIDGAPMLLRLHWDGVGFRLLAPMHVLYWRGMTRAAHRAASKGGEA